MAFMILTWINGFNDTMKFSIYCSDVSGAFDRVNRERFLNKLHAKGESDDIVKIIASWLDKREAVIIVGGCKGDPFTLEYMIYQGTVWGPRLWNIFYEDARDALNKHEYNEIVFADDLNAFRAFPLSEPHANLMATAKTCPLAPL